MTGSTLYPASLWPPRPVSTIQRFSCKAAGARDVTYDFCQSITTSAQRTVHCRGCACPWRICSCCVVLREMSDDIRTIDPATGICAFHTEHGPGARREEVFREEPPRTTLRRPPQAPAATVRIVPPTANPVPAPSIAEVAAHMGRLQDKELQLLRYYAQAMPLETIARTTNRLENGVRTAFIRLFEKLEIKQHRFDGTREQREAARTELVSESLRLFEARCVSEGASKARGLPTVAEVVARFHLLSEPALRVLRQHRRTPSRQDTATQLGMSEASISVYFCRISDTLGLRSELFPGPKAVRATERNAYLVKCLNEYEKQKT